MVSQNSIREKLYRHVFQFAFDDGHPHTRELPPSEPKSVKSKPVARALAIDPLIPKHKQLKETAKRLLKQQSKDTALFTPSYIAQDSHLIDAITDSESLIINKSSEAMPPEVNLFLLLGDEDCRDLKPTLSHIRGLLRMGGEKLKVFLAICSSYVNPQNYDTDDLDSDEIVNNLEPLTNNDIDLLNAITSKLTRHGDDTMFKAALKDLGAKVLEIPTTIRKVLCAKFEDFSKEGKEIARTFIDKALNVKPEPT